ncbi:MAG: IS256 family transposase [Smithellaceae bacterium]|nr:IS256 family transposase [Smithellaceae bacterium]
MARSYDTATYKKLLLHFMGELDPLYSMLQWLTERMMEVESELKVGAVKGKHSSDRTTHFSGTRVRRFDTRLGTMYLLVPKLRQGGYVPFFVTEKKRSEQALMQVIQEAFINGVSTRKMERLAQSLGIEGISAGQVSAMTKGLDEQVTQFRSRPLEKEYPVIWVDALYEKIRFDGRVISMAVLVVAGITVDGRRDILACEPMMNESEETYGSLFERLKERGLETVWLCVSDAHRGLRKALQKAFLGCSGERCKVHFMRNVMAHVSHKEKASFAAKLKTIWLQPTKKRAYQTARMLIDEYEKRFPDAMRVLEEGLEDALQFMTFSFLDHRKISSTNIIERLHREIRRRSRVVGIFPSMDSYLRLVSAYLIEYAEDWSTGKCYVRPLLIEEQRAALRKAA